METMPDQQSDRRTDDEEPTGNVIAASGPDEAARKFGVTADSTADYHRNAEGNQ